MSKHEVDLFVNTQEDFETFAHRLAGIVGRDLVPGPADSNVRYTMLNDELTIFVGNHMYENDRDMLFENYSIAIALRGRYIDRNDGSLTDKISIEQAMVMGRFIFDVLKKSGKCKLLLVFDLQRKIEQYDGWRLIA